MIDGGQPIQLGHRRALRIGDRHQRERAVRAQACLHLRIIEPAMQRGEAGRVGLREMRKLEPSGVEMDDVVIVRLGTHAGHDVAIDELDVGMPRQLAQRAGVGDAEPRRGARPAGRIERHVVALLDQRFGEERDDALGAAVFSRRDAFAQGRNLRDPHISYLLTELATTFGGAWSGGGRRDHHSSVMASRAVSSVCACHSRAKVPRRWRS